MNINQIGYILKTHKAFKEYYVGNLYGIYTKMLQLRYRYRQVIQVTYWHLFFKHQVKNVFWYYKKNYTYLQQLFIIGNIKLY